MPAGRGHVVAVDLAEKIVANLADIGPAAAERGDAGHRVADRAARDLDRRPHHPIERLGARRVDQGHRPLDQPFAFEKRLVGMGDHIDDGIADADDIEARLGHGFGAPRIPGFAGISGKNFGSPREIAQSISKNPLVNNMLYVSLRLGEAGIYAEPNREAKPITGK